MNQNALAVDYPKTPEAQLKWLMDRACITELLSAYSRALDRKDYDTLVSCFVHDGVLELPFGRNTGQGTWWGGTGSTGML
jgi:hypothetical protein